MKKSLSLVGASMLLVCGGSVFGQGAHNGTNDYALTNLNNFSHSYSNHYYYTNSGSGPWWSDMSRWSNSPAPRVWTNSQGVVKSGQRGYGQITPADVQSVVQQFQNDREAFLSRQRDLQRQMSTAGEQERQQLRDQLRDQMRDWQQQQARLKEQLQEQANRLRQQLQDHERLISQVSNPGNSSGSSGNGNSGSTSRGR